jgi:uncharacterized protein
MPPFSDMVPTPQHLQPMRGCIGWIVTDGRASSVAATEGVATALGLAAEHRQLASRALWNTLPTLSLLYPHDVPSATGGTLSPPWPDIVIAAGHRTIPYLQALRRASEGATFTVFLHGTRARRDIADLIWCPAHEHLSGSNIISTITSPHGMGPRQLRALRRRPNPEIDALSAPITAILLGGPNQTTKFNAAALAWLAECLRNLSNSGVSFLIAPSRRTTAPLIRTVTEATRSARRVVWARENSSSPHWTFLAHAELAIVTADSVTMTSAACATGRPVYVFDPGSSSEKLKRFHEALRQYGATKPLTSQIRPTELWSYKPLDSAPKIASEILRRFTAARSPRTLLPLELSMTRTGIC